MIDIIINIMHLNFLIHLFTHLNLFVLIITNLGRVFTALFIVAMTFMEKYANIFFFSTESGKLCDISREYIAQLKPCEMGPDHRHIVIGWDKTREVRVKGSYHTSMIVPSLGLVNRMESFKPLIHLLPLFFPPRVPCLSPPCPLPLSTLWAFVFYLFDFKTHGASASRRPVPFSFPAFIFIIIITVSFVFLFLLLTTVSSSSALLSPLMVGKRVSYCAVYASSWCTCHVFEQVYCLKENKVVQSKYTFNQVNHIFSML